MTNNTQTWQSLEQAQYCLETAHETLNLQRYPTVVLNAQLCAEHAAKAVIGCFEEAEWTHDPSRQLYAVINENQGDLTARLGEELVRRLRLLARDADELAPWHGWSTYGRRELDGTFVPPTTLCTPERANWALSLAERSFQAASDFHAAWLAVSSSCR